MIFLKSRKPLCHFLRSLATPPERAELLILCLSSVAHQEGRGVCPPTRKARECVLSTTCCPCGVCVSRLHPSVPSTTPCREERHTGLRIFANNEHRLGSHLVVWLLNGLLSLPLPRPSCGLPPRSCGFQLLLCRFLWLVTPSAVLEHCCPWIC